ncbi:helix-turn-helix domain-containing protein [Lactococcus garvieae]|uniref:helix-turn-helix domain-containing protein n=1 Tax=Lactococcus garvieae TaxID=1363 RepID=UPI001E40DA89|nr:helix-turn-helix transcriptional regulator [Lactococcus garvieae]MDN5629031.1 helix-turn-helix domain-containing protein [Lactococcus sp.]UHU65021.1 helix-turn-helix domain-containing protein [Lactococcus garvieae]
MRTNEEIVRILIEEKNRQGLSISELARRVDMAKSAISRYFNYTREFPLNRADDFAKVLGISTEYLLGISKEDSNKLENDSPMIEKTVEIMKKLDEPRQEVVLNTAKEQRDEQEAERKAKEPILLYMDDDAIYGHIDRAAAWQGEELTDEDRDAIMIALKKHLEEKAKEESEKGE